MLRRKNFRAVKGEEVEVQNIYEILPPDGTIIGMATEEEMKIAAELDAKHYALLRLQDSNFHFDGSSYKEMLKEMEEFEKRSIEFWRGIHKRLSIPWAWTVRIDIANGPIYIDNENLAYDAEEIEEEE
jgi:hypothetical protein